MCEALNIFYKNIVPSLLPDTIYRLLAAVYIISNNNGKVKYYTICSKTHMLYKTVAIIIIPFYNTKILSLPITSNFKHSLIASSDKK